MSKLFQAAQNITHTTNGAVAFKSTLDANLNLFFHGAASRGRDISDLVLAALDDNEDLAVRNLLRLRDVRGGAGERKLFRDSLITLRKARKSSVLRRLVKVIPELGRWDDLLVLVEHATPAVQELAIKAIGDALEAGNGLCAKWMPRKGAMAARLRKSFGMTPKQYRKTLVSLTKVVETQMCEGNWEGIDYSHVPSVAGFRYRKAFMRHDTARYEDFLTAVEKGDVKINAGAIYPHTLVKGVMRSADRTAEAQWKALPNFMEGSDERILPVVDVSGSMSWADIGGGITPMDVAVSLGLYISERNGSIFKDKMVTFESQPKLHSLKDSSASTLRQRVQRIMQAPWGGSTNLEGVFALILSLATRHNLTDEDLPTKVMILSDMQFNSACRNAGATLFENMKAQYAAAGYTMPQVVFWNLASNNQNVPVTVNTEGVALVSGFSPSILTNLLGGKLDPFTVMTETLMNPRYDW